MYHPVGTFSRCYCYYSTTIRRSTTIVRLSQSWILRNNPPGVSSVRSSFFSVDASQHGVSSRTTTSSGNSSNTVEPRQIQLQSLTHPDFPGAAVAVLTMNRPPANAMGRLMLQQLQEALSQIEDQVRLPPSSADNDTAPPPPSATPTVVAPPTPRCLVLYSALGPKVFSAGADLKERATMSVEDAAHFVTELRATFDRLARLPIPVLAALDGVAVGGGLELALAADVRLATRRTVLGLPETSLAIVPGAGGTQRLPRLMGIARAKEWIFTGQRLDAHTAAQYGLIQRIVDEQEAKEKKETNPTNGNAAKDAAAITTPLVLDVALEMAWKIAKNGPVAIQAAKWAVDRGMEADTMTEALEIERQAYARVLPTKDRLEGLAAFKEGRPPVYKGQ